MIPSAELNISGPHSNNSEELVGGFVEINFPCSEEIGGRGLLIDTPNQSTPTSHSSLFILLLGSL